MKDRKYWAADTDSRKVVNRLTSLHGDWSLWNTNPVVQAWLRNFIAYYSSILKSGQWATSLGFGGKQGELVEMVIPQARSLIRQLVTIITKQKQAFQVQAESSDGNDVVNDVRLGNALSDQVVDRERLESKGDTLCEGSFVMGQHFIGCLWRDSKGEVHGFDQETGYDVYKGDIDIFTLSTFDVLYDYTIQNWDDVPCVEMRFLKNRWDLIAENPDLEEEILRVPTVRERRGPYHWQDKVINADDMIYEYYWVHRPTPAVPNGRIICYASEEAVFTDDINKYGTIPLEVMRPEPIQTMGFGYPKFSDLLPAQEMLDHSFSAIATNQSAFAVQNVTAPRGAAINVEEIGNLNFISFTPMQGVQGGGRPESLQLTQSSPETFKFIDVLRSHMMELSTINSALRGSPPPGVTSGVAIATLTTNALEFIDSSARSYHQTMERVIMHAINAYKCFAKVERSVTMNGPNNQAFSKTFKGSDLKNLRGIKIVTSNPLMQTASGRLELADKLVSAGLIKSPQDYLLVLEGQSTKKLYETELSEADLMQGENDALQDGQEVRALSSDDHPAHVRHHSRLLNDPQVRANEKLVKIVTDHMLEHRSLADQTDPVFTAMVRTGKMPDMPPPPPMMPQGAPGAGPGGMVGALPAERKPANPANDLLHREGAA